MKVHTLLDLRDNIPAFVHVSNGKLHEENFLDEMTPEAGAFYVMDRGYLDFDCLYRFTAESAFFVIRNKSNVILRRRTSQKVDKSTGIRCD